MSPHKLCARMIQSHALVVLPKLYSNTSRCSTQSFKQMTTCERLPMHL